MKYRGIFTVVYSRKTGKILKEIWEPRKRRFWFLPWTKLEGEPKFESFEELSKWFEDKFPGCDIKYDYYGRSECED